jgi:hypothetical protein
MTERRVVDHDVFSRDAFGFQVGLEDAVGGARVHVVGTGENPALDAEVVHQVVDSRDCLLVRGGAGVEHVLGGFFAFVLHGVEQQAVQFLDYRQDGFTRYGGPAAEDNGHAFLRDQLAGFLREQRPVGGGVDDYGFELLAEQAAFLVLLFDHHQHGVLQRGFADGHRAGQRVQHADLDGVLRMRGQGKRNGGEAERHAGKDFVQLHFILLGLGTRMLGNGVRSSHTTARRRAPTKELFGGLPGTAGHWRLQPPAPCAG